VAEDEIKDKTNEPKAEPKAEKPAADAEAKPARSRARSAAPKKAPAEPAKPAKQAAKPAAGRKAAAAGPTAKAAAAKPAVKPRAARKKTESVEAAKPAEPVVKQKPPKAVAKPKPVKPAASPVGRLEATVVNADGQRLDTVKLTEARFGVATDVNTLHLAVRAQQNAHRRGTASTKTRGQVSGSTAKLYRQKGTGRARAGSVKSPVRVGGGITFGPHPRSYDIKINRKVARKALAMALSSRADTGTVFVARDLGLDDTPSTAALNRMLAAMDIPAPVLVVTADEPAVTLSARNLSFAETTEVVALSTEQVLRVRSLVFTEKAFAALEQG
jgi:large subunit ribosomal protein L4